MSALQPAADKASMTCSHLAIYLATCLATYLSSLPSSHPCIDLTFTLSLSLSCSLAFSMPPSLHLRSSAKLAANSSCYHVVLPALFGNLSLDLLMHPWSKLCIYLSSTVSTYGAPHTLQAPAPGNNCFGRCFWLLWRLSIYPHIYLSIYLPVYLPTYLPIYLSIYLSICLSVYLSIYLSLSLYLSLSINLSIHLSIYLSGLSLGPHKNYICLLLPYPSVYLFYLFFLLSIAAWRVCARKVIDCRRNLSGVPTVLLD